MGVHSDSCRPRTHSDGHSFSHDVDEQLQVILDTLAEGVAVSDQEGHIIQANRAFRELLAVEQVPGYDTTVPADQDLFSHVRDTEGKPLAKEQLAVQRALRGEVVEGPDADVHMQSLDGTERELHINAAPLRDRDGHIIEAVVAVRDMTWSKHLERALEEARANEFALRELAQRMDEFVATASHDLRAPLAVAVGMIDLAASRFERLASEAMACDQGLAAMVEKVHSSLEGASQGVDRLNRLVQILFDTSQAHAGSPELHQRPCDLAAVVREQVAAVRTANPTRTIHVEGLGSGALEVMADADRIGQVVTNYLTNALKYSAKDQPVTVRVAAKDRVAHVSVEDHGPGLPNSEKGNIWQKYYRYQGSRVQRGSNFGMGLGLYICKTIIDGHGGRVGVDSKVGEGSTFWFTLPLGSQQS
jgi:PAS domain S-box-containing protein